MKHWILAILLSLAFVPSVFADTDREWRTGLALGSELDGDFVAITITRNWFPTTRDLSWGVRTYGELARYDFDGDSGNAITLAVEPVVTWRGFYAGIGPSIGNITPKLGTVLNFSTTVGYDYELRNGMRVGVFINHRSHGTKLGIAKDKENGGVTTVNLQAVFAW